MPIIINLIVEPDTPSTEIQIKLYVTRTLSFRKKEVPCTMCIRTECWYMYPSSCQVVLRVFNKGRQPAKLVGYSTRFRRLL